MCWATGTPVSCGTFAPALGRECRQGTQCAGTAPGSDAEALPTVLPGGGPGSQAESRGTRKKRSAGTRMYLQGDAGTPSADVIRAVLPWGWGARDPGLVTVFTIVFLGGRYMTRKLLSCLTLKRKIPLRKEPFNPYDCNVPMGGIWSGCWACLLKTDCLYLFCSAIQIILQYVYSMTKIN